MLTTHYQQTHTQKQYAHLTCLSQPSCFFFFFKADVLLKKTFIYIKLDIKVGEQKKVFSVDEANAGLSICFAGSCVP